MNSQAWAGAAAPSLDDFASLAEAALARLPEPFRTMAGDVRLLADMGIEDAFELTGVYIGVDLRRQSVLDPAPHPSEVLLFRRPILDEWAERGDVALGDLIEHVLVHEIGHHFGLSDDDIHAAEED
jgi:predicted Zn-dependent protease with MMP-like domain